MTREEKYLLAIQLGYTYDPENGEIKNKHGKVLKTKNKEGYLYVNVTQGTHLLQHQLGWYLFNKEIVTQIDHINSVRDDNRISNLRSVTNQQNQFNRDPKGYYWNKSTSKWKSGIRLNGKYIYLGLFDNEEDARQSYLKSKEIYHTI